MKALQQVTTNQHLRTETAWRLLAADNAPITLGLLAAHLLDKERRLPSSILHERIARELELLQARGEGMTPSAQHYIAQWLSAGFLERTYESKASEEFYELSAAAVQAIRFIRGLSDKRAIATESRLSLVIQQLVQLAEQTETDPQSRIESLIKERNRIDAEINKARQGKLQTLADDRALERARELVALADELANDFLHVRTEFQQLNRVLRESIMESEGSRGDVLDDVFAGVDVIADSEQGRTFRSFWRLLTDPVQSMELETALEQVLSREFAPLLERHERVFLGGLTRVLLARGGEVHEVLHRFARGLKQFVQSREYLEQRRINQLLKQAQRGAMAVKDRLQPTTSIGYTLNLTSSKIKSVSQFRLKDPSLDEVDSTIRLADAVGISLESISELVAQSEIDFRKLKQHIQILLKQRDQVSIGEVLQVYAADQGLGSVVGYISLGSRFGVISDRRETVTWTGKDGVERKARIPCLYFVRGHSDVLG